MAKFTRRGRGVERASTQGGIGKTGATLVAGDTAAGVAAAPTFTAVLPYRLMALWLRILTERTALVHLHRTGKF